MCDHVITKEGGGMVVLRLVPRRVDAGTVRVLRSLLSHAEAGNLSGFTGSYRMRNGNEDCVFTGVYKDRPAEAVRAAMCISWRLTQLHDETCGPP